MQRIIVPVITVAALLAPRCHDDHASAIAGLEDVEFAANVNDEALDLLLKATAVDGKGQGAVFDLPVEASAVAAQPPYTFSWHLGLTARDWQPGPKLDRRSPSLHLPFGVASAYAHGEATSGRTYFLVVSAPDNPKLLRVFTKATTYTPGAAAWARLKAAKGLLKAVVTTATFDTGKLTADGGPYLGKPVAFSITP